MSTAQKLNTLALTLLITGSIDSIRNLPASALFGSALIFFFAFSAVVFLIPSALVSAELAANADKSGIYHWTKLAFGDRMGFLAVWLQWINSVIWFPTILSFIAGTAAYLIDPALADNKMYLITVILASFWGLTLINLRGIRLSAIFSGICALFGLIFPMILIILLLAMWIYLGNPMQIHLTSQSMIPSWNTTDSWFALTAFMSGFLGMELAAVHISEVNKPKSTFPKALAISTIVIVLTMTLGSLSIAYVLPNHQINLVNGTIQTFSYFLRAYHLEFLTPILTCMLVIGSLGGTMSWIVSPARGMHQAAKENLLPAFFAKTNKHGMPSNLLIAQAILVSIVCLAFLLLPSVNGSYWFLSALSTQLYMIMYVIMFISAIRLKSRLNYKQDAFVIPGKRLGHLFVCLLGLLGCAITLLVGFIPPTNINVGGAFHYEMLFCISIVIMILPVLGFYYYQSWRKQQAVTSQPILGDVEAVEPSVS